MTPGTRQNRLGGYTRRAMRYCGYRGTDLDSRVRDVEQTIARIEIETGDAGLTRRIEDKLANRSFRGSAEQRILRMAIDSVAEGRLRRNRTREELLDGRAFVAKDADPAALAERGELREILRREIEALPDRLRIALEEVYLRGRTQADVARQHNTDRRRINEDLKHALLILADRLRQYRGFRMPDQQ